jgi:histidine triad (HIT) family protein
MNNCIFCQIVTRHELANVVYEDDRVIAFVPIHPVSVGHTLVVPKSHYENLSDITVESLNDVVGVAKSIAVDLLAKHGATGINLLHATGKDAQQSLVHFHLHVVPRYPQDGPDLWFLK